MNFGGTYKINFIHVIFSNIKYIYIYQTTNHVRGCCGFGCHYISWLNVLYGGFHESMNNFNGQITPSSIFNTSSNESKHYWICRKTISLVTFTTWLYFQVLCNICKFMMLNIHVFKLMLNTNEQCDFQMVSNVMMCGHHN